MDRRSFFGKAVAATGVFYLGSLFTRVKDAVAAGMIREDGSYYYTEIPNWPDRNSGVSVFTSGLVPQTWRRPSVQVVAAGDGDNQTSKGVTGIYVRAEDMPGVDGNTKGMLYAIEAQIAPRVPRNNVPADDANGLVIFNDPVNGPNRGTDAIYVGHASQFGAQPEWLTAITLDCNAHYAVRANGVYQTAAIDTSAATINTGYAIKIGDGQKFKLVNPPVVTGNTKGQVEATLVSALASLGLIKDETT
jgi:hypothetical protein